MACTKGFQYPPPFVEPPCALFFQIPVVFAGKTQHIVSPYVRSTIFGTSLAEIHTGADFGGIIQKKHEPAEL